MEVIFRDPIQINEVEAKVVLKHEVRSCEIVIFSENFQSLIFLLVEKLYGTIHLLKDTFGFIMPSVGEEHLYFNERDGINVNILAKKFN